MCCIAGKEGVFVLSLLEVELGICVSTFKVQDESVMILTHCLRQRDKNNLFHISSFNYAIIPYISLFSPF